MVFMPVVMKWFSANTPHRIEYLSYMLIVELHVFFCLVYQNKNNVNVGFPIMPEISYVTLFCLLLLGAWSYWFFFFFFASSMILLVVWKQPVLHLHPILFRFQTYILMFFLIVFLYTVCIVVYHYLLFDESDQRSLSNQTIVSVHTIVPSKKNSSEVVDDFHHDFLMKKMMWALCAMFVLWSSNTSRYIFELQWKKLWSFRSKLVQFTFLKLQS